MQIPSVLPFGRGPPQKGTWCIEAIEDAMKVLGLIDKVHGKDIPFEKRKMKEIIAYMKS